MERYLHASYTCTVITISTFPRTFVLKASRSVCENILHETGIWLLSIQTAVNNASKKCRFLFPREGKPYQHISLLRILLHESSALFHLHVATRYLASSDFLSFNNAAQYRILTSLATQLLQNILSTYQY
jgi:hypothetical protein